MSHYYAYRYCRECLKMDLNDRNKYDRNEAYCSEYHKYYNPNSKACSTYFVYDDARNNNPGCYLTTLVCEIMGMDDNSSYLQTLRNFRENYMKKEPSLYPILYEYDIVGPVIVDNLKEDSFKHIRGLMMLENYIKPIVQKINNQEYSVAIDKYVEMVTDLKDFYHIDTPNIEIQENINLESLGKGHKLKIRKI